MNVEFNCTAATHGARHVIDRMDVNANKKYCFNTLTWISWYLRGAHADFKRRGVLYRYESLRFATDDWKISFDLL